MAPSRGRQSEIRPESRAVTASSNLWGKIAQIQIRKGTRSSPIIPNRKGLRHAAAVGAPTLAGVRDTEAYDGNFSLPPLRRRAAACVAIDCTIDSALGRSLT